MVCPRNLLHPLRNRKKRLMGRFFLHISKKSSTFAAQNRKMRKAQVIVGLLVCVLVSGTLYAKRPVTDVEQARRGGTEVERLQRAIKKQPGDMDKHCELVQAQLAAGDTTAAEKSIEYAMKMRETPCLYMQRAMIGVARADLFAAARYSAQAVKAGLRPSEDSAVYRIDSLSGGGVTLCLQRLAGEEKQQSDVYRGLAEMAAMKGDTSVAIAYYRKAVHAGDTTCLEAMKILQQVETVATETDSVTVQIPFMNQTGELELKGKINGLVIRITVDTTATQSTISGVETLFMLKNEYVSQDDIIDNIFVIAKRLEIGEGMVLRDIRLRYIENQDCPLILCLHDLERLGRIQILPEKRVLTIRQTK